MKKWIAFLCILPTIAKPCEWDYDTLELEAKGNFDLVHALTGRFPRNWPGYYKMRLKRVEQLLKKNPNDWEAYDAAAVANDRLGNVEEAVRWNDRKRVQMTRVGLAAETNKDAWYRYHANAGTHFAHRWVRNGADKQNDKDLERAEAHIAKAIEINPDAHFGREVVQLEILRWLRQSNEAERKGQPFENLALYLSRVIPDKDVAIKGLMGIIIMGSGWESVDIFGAIGDFLIWEQDNYLAYLSKSRAIEIAADGKTSLGAGMGKLGVNVVAALDLDPRKIMIEDKDRPKVEAQYRALRKHADVWLQSRNDFMYQQFVKGKHPDTHKDFWTGFQEIPAPKLEQIGGKASESQAFWWASGGGAVLGLGMGTIWWLRRRAA